MTTILGLVETKRSNAASAGDNYDQAVDPDAVNAENDVIVINPSVSLDRLYNDWARTYLDLQNNYKFVLGVTKKRVQLGSAFSVKNNYLTFNWILYSTQLNDEKQPVKKIFKRVQQQAIAFVRADPDDANSVIVTLRPQQNGTLINDLIEQLTAQNVEVAKLVPLLASCATQQTEPDGPSEEEQKAAEEAEKARLIELEAQRLALELAERSPLQFSQPPAYDDINYAFVSTKSLFLGEITDDDFQAPIADDAEPDADAPAIDEENVAGKSKPREPTVDELNAKGKQVFENDQIMSQIFAVYEQVRQFFPPLVNVTVTADDGSTQAVPHSTVYCCNDVQYLFENQYSDIYKLSPREALIHLFPLVRVAKESSRQDLWIQSQNTGEYLHISRPQEFSIMGFLMEKDQYGYVLHKCRPLSTETNTRTTRQIGELFEQCFSKLVSVTTVFREKKLYSVSTEATAGCACNQQPRQAGTNLLRNLKSNKTAQAPAKSSSSSSSSIMSRRTDDRDDMHSVSSDDEEYEPSTRHDNFNEYDDDELF